MLEGTTIILMHYSFIALVFLSVIVGFLLFFRKDAPHQGRSAVLWTILTVSLSSFAPAIYFFLTRRIKWALFWLLVFPVVFYFAQIGVFMATEAIPHTHAEGQGHGESVPHTLEEELSLPVEEVTTETLESSKTMTTEEVENNKNSYAEEHTHSHEHGDDAHSH